MPIEEVEIMREMFCFLRDHNDPPANDSEEAKGYWMQTCKDMGATAERLKNHPLAITVLCALSDYLEQKAKAKGVS